MLNWSNPKGLFFNVDHYLACFENSWMTDKSHFRLRGAGVSCRMSSFRIRPRFKHHLTANQDDLEKNIATALADEKQFTFYHLPGHICIKIHPNQRHVWSPQLDLSFEQQDDTVEVRGLYGPAPTLWALFFFGYVIIGLSAIALGMWGISVWMIGGTPSVLWAIPGLGVVALALYVFSQAGQKLGAQQLFDIHHFYEKITKDKIRVT